MFALTAALECRATWLTHSLGRSPLRHSFATTVVLAALAAPLDSTAPRSLVTLIDGDSDGASRNIRLAEYLNMTKAPTRDLLMRELVR